MRSAVQSGRFDVACAASREDAFPLRMALLVRHLDEDLPLVVTIFDPAIARQVEQTIPHCQVTSVADIVAPLLAGQCLDPDIVAVRRTDSRWVGLDKALEEVELPDLRARKARSLARGRASSRTTAAPACCSTARSGWSRCCCGSGSGR